MKCSLLLGQDEATEQNTELRQPLVFTWRNSQIKLKSYTIKDVLKSVVIRTI